MSSPTLTPQEIAERVKGTMLAHDAASKSFGIQVIEIAPGFAKLQMMVRSDMLNGFSICHGGIVTTLADSAFGFACNSYNDLTVASNINIDLIEASYLGDILTAEAMKVSLKGRLGIFNVVVKNQNDQLIAVMRGKSYKLNGKQVFKL